MNNQYFKSTFQCSIIITANDINVTALGAQQKLRGKRYKASRSTLIIVDYIENDDGVRSKEQRDKLSEWFFKAVMKAGTEETNVLMVGTVQHYDSLLANLVGHRKYHGWQKHMYRSVIEWAENNQLWEEWAEIYNRLQSFQDMNGPEGVKYII